MKAPSAPLDVCPFCGKAFKRLKSHLPHCKMAETKNMTPETDSRGKSMNANLVPMKTTGTRSPIVEKQDPKVKGKSKTEAIKRQVQQETAISLPQTKQAKVRKVTSGNRLAQQKATIEDSKKGLQTTQMVTSTKEQGQNKVALTEPSVPVQQACVLWPSLEKTIAAKVHNPRASNILLTVEDHIWTEDLKEDRIRLSVPEQDTEGSPVNYTGVRDQSQGPFHAQFHLDHSSVPVSLTGPTTAPVVIGWSTNISKERVKTHIPGITPTVSNIESVMCDSKALGMIRKSAETKMDVPPPPWTVQIEPPQLVDHRVGLQWAPQLYSSYVQLGIVPGRQDQWDPHQRGTKILEPIERLPEFCKTESSLKKQSTSKPLLDVRLGELPVWLANCRYSPKIFPQFIKNAWGRYYNKYINVRKGGVGGLTMLLAGYCVLSYSWNYNHIKQDRWRKYH
ncbi:uncharacterized protein C17orf80 homolog [Hyla sarda]|uniref:uncharacterized protein C17orf80 homolog n=1 Tax=Hyla sarda TaxID=327740 RepID=UPI0024C25F67|nr:uncharacterized protein C17orf80 homolog [Hyla sarda]